MNNFKSVTISSTCLRQQKAILSDVIATLNPAWKYNKHYSLQYAIDSCLDPSEVACFESPALHGQILSSVWVISRNLALTVSNIVPLDTQKLTHQEYNDILTLFVDDCLKAVAKAHGVNIEISLAPDYSGKISDPIVSRLNYLFLNFTF